MRDSFELCYIAAMSTTLDRQWYREAPVKEVLVNFVRKTIAAIIAVGFSFLGFVHVGEAAERIVIGKRYEGGVEMTARPNIVMAQWRLTVDSITTESSLRFMGIKHDNIALLESRVVERNNLRKIEKQVHQEEFEVRLDCEGDMVKKIDPLTLALRISEGNLKFTVLADWDTNYIDPDTAILRCRSGHEWLQQKDRRSCPLCGANLEKYKP